MRTVRSYQKLVNEIINLQIPFRVEIIGYVQYKEVYPMMAIRHISKTAKKNIVITSGIHGDEYYATHVLLKWLQQVNPELFNDFNFHIFPVVNPFGYSKGYRDNGARQDINKPENFVKDSKVQELAIVFEHFPLEADLVIDVHGDTGKEEVYAYEHKSENLASIAEKALLDNDSILPFIKTKTIYEIKVNNGVCEDREESGYELGAEKLGTMYTITIELPGKCSAQIRTSGGIKIINSLLTNFKSLEIKSQS
jgi:predicted deacylase